MERVSIERILDVMDKLSTVLSEVSATNITELEHENEEEKYENTGEWYAKLDLAGTITMLDEYVPKEKSYIEIDDDGINFIKDSQVSFRIDGKGFRPVKERKCSCKGENY